jgi:hypothetical protein
MKKIFTTFLSFLIVLALSAQVATKTGAENEIFQSSSKFAVKTLSDKAVGDTLFYFDGYYFYLQTADEADFAIVNEDLDLLTPTNASFGWTSDFMYFYSLEPWLFFPNDVDSAFFIGATSWFTPAGQADNWYAFGPITIPATGAILKWHVRTNPSYRDGYRVLTSVTGMENYTDFSNPPLYVRPDLHPSPNTATDTLFQSLEVDIPWFYAGQRIYVAFHHNANDMDVIYFDEVTIVEDDLNPGIAEQESVQILENYPNPATDFTTISFNIAKAGKVNMQLFDMTGRQINTYQFGQMSSGLNRIEISTSALSSGIYFYSITLDDQSSMSKKLVVR